jgi:peptide-methionine (R)-S-oxide reductase
MSGLFRTCLVGSIRRNTFRSMGSRNRKIPTKGQCKKTMTELQYQVCFEGSTEPPFTGEYWDKFYKGEYKCVVCGTPLFSSGSKFYGECGWASFDATINGEPVKEIADTSHDMVRTEVRCARCSCHLGHVFKGERTQTGLRYCINSASLEFKGEAKKPSE